MGPGYDSSNIQARLNKYTLGLEARRKKHETLVLLSEETKDPGEQLECQRLIDHEVKWIEWDIISIGIMEQRIRDEQIRDRINGKIAAMEAAQYD